MNCLFKKQAFSGISDTTRSFFTP